MNLPVGSIAGDPGCKCSAAPLYPLRVARVAGAAWINGQPGPNRR